MTEEKLTKVVLRQEYDDGEVMIETPWAEELGDNQYKLKNFPFQFYGLSFDDIFEAEPLHDDDDRPYFVRVIKKSGHKTVRIILPESIKESEQSRQMLERLNEMGCGYEGSDGETFFVVNIQPHCDFWEVCNFLIENNIEWEHADPTYEELHPEDETPPPMVQEVLDILDMWSFVEYAYGELSEDDKKKLEEDAHPFGKNPRFPGFDGDNESEHMNIASFLINDLERFQEFKGRSLNANRPTLEMHHRMLSVFENICSTLNSGPMSLAQLATVLRENILPEHRGAPDK